MIDRGRALAAALAGAAVVGGAAAGYAVERRLARARLGAAPRAAVRAEPTGRRSHVVAPDGTTVAIETFGVADGPQIVLVHGWVLTAMTWLEQVRALADRAWLVTYDQPGHGRSSPPPDDVYRLDRLGDALIAVVDAVTRPGPVVLVGHSLGGMTVLNALRRNPGLRERVTGVVLLSTAASASIEDATLGIGIPALARFERSLTRLTGLVRRPARAIVPRVYRASSDVSYLLTRTLGMNPDADPAHVRLVERLIRESDVDTITGMIVPMVTLAEDAELERLDVPVTVVCGTRDRMTPPAFSVRLAERLPRARLVLVPEVGHVTPFEAHVLVTRLVAEAAGVAVDDLDLGTTPAAAWTTGAA